MVIEQPVEPDQAPDCLLPLSLRLEHWCLYPAAAVDFAAAESDFEAVFV